METESLGPWNGGLNLSSNRDLSVFLKNNELGEATNVIFTNEGYIEPRPGCKVVIDHDITDNLYEHVTPEDGKFSLIGRVVNDQGVWALVQVSYGTNQRALYKVLSINDVSAYRYSNFAVWKLFEYTGHNITHAIVHSGFTANIPAGHVPPAPVPAGQYDYQADSGILMFTDIDTTTYLLPFNLPVYTSPAVPPKVDVKFKVPASHIGMVVKDRLFLFDKVKNKMWWSPPGYILDFRTDAAVVAVAPFGKDTAGEENIEPTHSRDLIRNVAFYNNNFYIFKAFKTYMFTYQDNPTTDGYMRKISNETGAFDCCVFKDTIIVINNRGVFRIQGTEFIDLQQKMNFGFEIPLDTSNIDPDDLFITTWNQNILFGVLDKFGGWGGLSPKHIYYNLNTEIGAWSKWEFDYAPNIASPGSESVFTQDPNSSHAAVVFTTFDKKYLVHMHWKPTTKLWNYHLDSDLSTPETWYDKLYFPNVVVKTSASFGGSTLYYKKLYRYFIRFYLSEPPASLTEDPVWTLSINYNDYKFDSTKNPIFGLYPVSDQSYPTPLVSAPIHTAVYKRVYQVVLPQQRAKEFVVELKRRYTEIPIVFDTSIVNDDADRVIKNGYYFALSGLWVHYENKAQI